MSNLLVQEFQGKSIRFETREDGRVWGCLTDMANATGKKVNDYLRLLSTKEYVESLSEVTGIPAISSESYLEGLIIVNKEGTWAIDEIVMDFARWCSIPFRIWANRVVRDVTLQGYHISLTATSEQLEAAHKKIEQLQIEKGYLLEWSPRMSLQKMRFLELINFKASEYSPYLLDVHDQR